MAVTFGSLKKNERTIPVEYAGETINVTYRPGVITPAFLKSISELPAEKAQLVAFLSQAMLKWDVVEDEDPNQAVPIGEAVLMDTPNPVLIAIDRAIRGDVLGDPKKS